MKFIALLFFLASIHFVSAQRNEYEFTGKSNRELVKSLHAEKRIARNELFQLFDYYNDNDNDSTYLLAHKVIEIGIKQEDWFYINYGKALIAAFYNNNDRIEMATKLAKESLNYFLNQDDFEMISYLQNQIGISMVSAKKYKEAIKWFKKSVESGEQTNDFPSNCVGLKNIAEVYYIEQNTEKAIEYATKFLNIIKETDNNVAKVKAYNTMGNIYRDMDRIDKARYYYEKALTFPLKSETTITKGNVLNNLAMVYFGENPAKSKEFFFRSLAVRKMVNRPMYVADSYLNLGHWHFMMNDLDSATYYYNTMLTYCQKTRHVEGELEALDALKTVEDEKGNYKMYDYYAQEYEVLEKSSKQSKSQIIEEFISKTDGLIQAEENLIKTLSEKRKARFANQDLQQQRIIIVGIIFAMLFFGGFAYVNKRRKTLFRAKNS